MAKITKVKPVQRKKVEEPVKQEAKAVDTVFADVPAAPEPRATPDDIVKPDSDLDAQQKAEFARLLREGLGLEERAKRLINLTKFVDSKRAPVALRAIQEINAITGITADAPEEGSPLFVLNDGAEIAVAVRIPKK